MGALNIPHQWFTAKHRYKEIAQYMYDNAETLGDEHIDQLVSRLSAVILDFEKDSDHQRIVDLEEENEGLKKEVENLEENVDELKKEASEWEDQAAKFEAQVNQLEEKVGELEEQVDDLQDEVRLLRSNFDEDEEEQEQE